MATNIELLRTRIRAVVGDVKIDDTQLDEIINHTIQDIAQYTKLFKKLYGFTVHKDVEMYNFRAIARMNEETEQEPSSITISDPDIRDVLEFIQDGEFADPKVDKTLEEDLARSLLIDVLDIFDQYGNSVLNKFSERGSAYYYCYDAAWREANHNEPFVFAGWITPHIDELSPEYFFDLLPALVAGCKFFINDLLHSPSDTQATNYDFMRYYQAKEHLLNKFPASVISVDTERIKQWL
jgi:hypothetical protein